MAVDYEAEFLSEQKYEGEFVAAAIKPEIVGKAVPSYEKQVLYPDPGCVFGSMEIEAIPEPTEQMDIFTNGEHHVERIGIVKVQVPQGVFPTGTVPISTNGLHNVAEYETAEVTVDTDPEIGVVFSDFLSSGLPETARTVGMTALPAWLFYTNNYYNRSLLLSQIKTLIINEGATTLRDSCARGMKTLLKVVMPSTLLQISANAFLDDAEVMEYDFRACTAVPSLATAATLGHAEGCVIRVPSALLNEWQTANIWKDITDIVWG